MKGRVLSKNVISNFYVVACYIMCIESNTSELLTRSNAGYILLIVTLTARG